MAFKRNPTNDTYSQHFIPACYTLHTDPYTSGVNLTLGHGMRNLVPKKYKVSGAEGDDMLYAVNRPPITAAVIDVANTSGMPARGVYVWEKTTSLKYYFVVVNNRVYTSDDAITWTHVDTLLNVGSDPVGFTEFLNSATNTKSLVLVDGFEGYVYTSNAAGTKITDADFPSPHLPFPVYLDGYLFLAKPDTGDIYNSDLNSATAWTAGSFISSELYPDDMQAITKVNNYLLAIGTQGCEYFYDNANPTGSPLKRIDGANLPFGTFFPWSIASNKDTVTFLANMNDGEPAIVHIKGQEWKEITPDFMMPILLSWIDTVSISYSNVWGYYTRSRGDLLYCLNTEANPINTSTRDTWAFSFDHGMWMLFSITGDASYTQQAFPITRTAFSGKTPVTYCIGYINGRPFFGKWSEGADGTLAYGVDQITDSGLTGPGGTDSLSMICQVTTPILTFGTLNLKEMSRFGINGHYIPEQTPSVFKVSCYDWPGASSTYDLSFSPTSDDTPNPFLAQCGSFRKRSISVKAYPEGGGVAIFGFYCDINKDMK